jgi:hypothetical protein
MKSGPGAAAVQPSSPPLGGDQFPPIDELTPAIDAPVTENDSGSMGAMDKLTARQNASGEQGSSKVEGFEASVHKIKEQVLPRLLERVDPEAAATLSKDELAEEFRPIISEVLAELKITLNRREQFALEKVLVDELLGLGPLEELLADPAISDIMVNGPEQTYVERKGKLELAQIQFRDEEHLFQIAQRIVNKVGLSKNNLPRLIDQALNGIFSFTSVPMRLCSFVGLAMAALCFLYATFAVGLWFVRPDLAPRGMTTIIVALFFLSGMQLTFIGILGEYVTSIHNQVRKRPLVVERERLNMDDLASPNPVHELQKKVADAA